MPKHRNKELYFRRTFNIISICSGLVFAVEAVAWLFSIQSIENRVEVTTFLISFLGLITSYVFGLILLIVKFKTLGEQRVYTTFFGSHVFSVVSWIVLGITTYFLTFLIFSMRSFN